MLDLVKQRKDAWPERLRPLGEGDFDKEPFADWWAKWGKELVNLHPEIAEQWVYRHWTWAKFKFLELQRIRWRKERLTTVEFFHQIHLEFGGPVEGDFDFAAFMGAFGTRETATARNWRRGTWTIPAVVLSTPKGIIGVEGSLPEVRLVVVEGSKRYRWLNALYERGEAPGPHDFYVLEYEGIEGI